MRHAYLGERIKCCREQYSKDDAVKRYSYAATQTCESATYLPRVKAPFDVNGCPK